MQRKTKEKNERKGSYYHDWYGEKAYNPIHHRHKRIQNPIATLLLLLFLQQLKIWEWKMEREKRWKIWGKKKEFERKSLIFCMSKEVWGGRVI